jgi:hypothetical protein
MSILALLKKSVQFEKLATFFRECSECESEVSNIEVVKNRDPLLKQLSDLKSYDERVDLAKEHFEHLGTGSSRSIFRISEELILKVAINDKGLAQVITEARPEAQCACSNNIIAFDPNGRWSISRFTNNITEKDFKKLTGMGFKAFSSALYYKLNNETDDRKPKDYEEIEQNTFFKCMSELAFKLDLLSGDLSKVSSYGEMNGKVLVRDTGFSKEVWRKLYKKDTSSSSAS